MSGDKNMPNTIWAWKYQSYLGGEIHRQWAPNKISDSDLHETEYRRVDAVVDWQPIETAPTDGTPILGARQGSKWQQVLYWDDGCDAGWYSSAGREHHPSHWQPLPEPPA